MASLRELLEAGQAGLTVYSPDCTQSRLWGNLDHMIHEATGFQVVRRQWINHDINSILRFYRGPDDEPPAEQDPAEALRKYDNIPAEMLQYGHLVVKLLMMGPSLLTIWRGENAIPTLLKVKGKTQPAEAAPDSIRGGFWCDNGVCNLTHTSDDASEATRELTGLRLDHWLNEDSSGQEPLIDPIPAPTFYAPHSGISMVAEIASRVLVASGKRPLSGYISPADAPDLKITLPDSGNAHETNKILTGILRAATMHHSESPIVPFINAFLAGDLVGVTEAMKLLPVTRWEHFVIQCGAVNRDRWNNAG